MLEPKSLTIPKQCLGNVENKITHNQLCCRPMTRSSDWKLSSGLHVRRQRTAKPSSQDGSSLYQVPGGVRILRTNTPVATGSLVQMASTSTAEISLVRTHLKKKHERRPHAHTHTLFARSNVRHDSIVPLNGEGCSPSWP